MRTILPEPTLRRLPWYLAFVRLLSEQGVEYVSSTQIAKELNVDASQIAKDLSFLNLHGKTRIGYHVETLMHELSDFLGFKEEHRAFIIGVGSLGEALIHDSGLEQFGLKIVAGFDIRPELIGTTIRDVPIFSIDDIAACREKFDAGIAVLTVPVESAQDTADLVIAGGMKAIWNFTPFRIKASGDIVIQNTSIYAHLALIYNRMTELNLR